MNDPIIQCLTDTDVYKFNMMYLVWKLWRRTLGESAMNNRSRRVRLAEIIPEEALREQLDHALTLRFGSEELEQLESFRLEDGRPQYSSEFVKHFLADFQLPQYELKKTADGQYDMRFPGTWAQFILWETLAMSIVTELRGYYTLAAEGKKMADLYDEGRRRRDAKIERLNSYPGIRFMEFVTRRRYSRDWHDELVGELKSGLHHDQMTGTSNVWLARKYGLKAQGTQAHELFMAYARLFGNDPATVRHSQNRVLQDWWDLYGHSLSIALTDTYGTEFFFRMMTPEQARLWKGLRQDSGDPFVFGERAISFYRKHEVNPLDKLVVFSDGLDLDRIIALYERFSRLIQVAFGWGTNLGNDLGIDPISLVIKLVQICGVDCVKLSDNLAKAIGPPELVAFLSEVFGYTVGLSEECRY